MQMLPIATMDLDITSALAHLIELQNHRSSSEAVERFLNQYLEENNHNEQSAIVIGMNFFLETRKADIIDSDVISRTISRLCAPEINSALHRIQKADGEYAADIISECVISLTGKLFPLLNEDGLKHDLLSAATSVLSEVYINSDGADDSEPWARGVRFVSRVAVAAMVSLSDTELQQHHACLENVLDGLIGSDRPAASQTGAGILAPLLLARPDFAASYSDRLAALLRPRGDADLSRCLAAACALSDHLLSAAGGRPEPPSQLWPLIGRGLTAADALERKRGRYLLQRAVEARRSAGRDADGPLPWRAAAAGCAGRLWDELALMLETLEEKQVHLVRPVLRRLDALLASRDLVPLFWSLCVLRRAFGHSNGFIVRWALLRALELSPEDELEDFVSEALVPALNDVSLYADVELSVTVSAWEAADQEQYNCQRLEPPTECGRRLRAFLTAYLSGAAVSQRAAGVVSAVAGLSWSSVALLHVAHALSAVPVPRCLAPAAAAAVCRLLAERLQAQEPALRRTSRHLLLGVALGWLRPAGPALDCLLAAAGVAEAPPPLAGLEAAAVRRELEAALAAGRTPERGRLLGGALRLLADLLPLDERHPALGRLRTSLVDCHSQLYRPPAAVVADVALLAALAGPAPPPAVRHLLAEVAPAVVEFVVRQVETAAAAEDLELGEFYAEFLRAAAAAGLTADVTAAVRRLCEVSDGDHPLRVFATAVIVSSLVDSLDRSLLDGGGLSGPLVSLAARAGSDAVSTAMAGCPGAAAGQTPLPARLVEATWRLTRRLLSAGLLSPAERLRLAPAAVSALSVCPRRALTALLDCLPPLLEAAGPGSLEEAAAAAWSALFEHRRSEAFGRSLAGLARLLFSPVTLAEPALAAPLQEWAGRLLALAESVPAALLELLARLTDVWSRDAASLPRHLPAVVAALLHGPVHRRDRRALQDAVGFVSGPRAAPAADHLVDRAVRAAGVRALRQLARAGAAEPLRQLATELQRRADEAGGGRHFGNSAGHRVQQRACQALLVLHTALPEEEQVRLCAATCGALLRGHPQPSVRYLQEWLVICLCLQRPELTQHVWTHLERAGVERTGSIGSFVAILTHLAQSGAAGGCESAEQFVRRCFCRVLPWCMAQHFNTRMYSQVALQRLWTLARERQMAAILSEFAVVYDSVSQSLQHGNANRNSQLILNDFYFTEFDPVKHFSIEAIYEAVPRLASVDQDEWVPPWLFAADVCDAEETDGLPRLGRLCPDLRAAQPACWTARTADLRPGDVADAAPDGESGGAGLQRKPTPWRQLLPDAAAAAEAQRGRPAGAASALVLVAALVDKAPNLGGLCRTCEVLGAGRLVVPSLQVAADKQFQNLSVSAERWLQLTEVKPHQLPTYLEQMRSAGYTLVGVEQTSSSVPVTEYKFPAKTLLLLGNEKEGIPVELIQLLDVCLEIPQRGLVRSLNVHVAGALLVWEYSRQHHR